MIRRKAASRSSLGRRPSRRIARRTLEVGTTRGLMVEKNEEESRGRLLTGEIVRGSPPDFSSARAFAGAFWNLSVGNQRGVSILAIKIARMG